MPVKSIRSQNSVFLQASRILNNTLPATHLPQNSPYCIGMSIIYELQHCYFISVTQGLTFCALPHCLLQFFHCRLLIVYTPASDLCNVAPRLWRMLSHYSINNDLERTLMLKCIAPIQNISNSILPWLTFQPLLPTPQSFHPSFGQVGVGWITEPEIIVLWFFFNHYTFGAKLALLFHSTLMASVAVR